MAMFGKKEPTPAANRLKPFADGKFVVRAHAFAQKLLGDKMCWKIAYVCVADTSENKDGRIEPNTRGELALFPLKKDQSMGYVAKDLINFYAVMIAAEMGKTEALPLDLFVMNSESKDGGRALIVTGKDGDGDPIYERYPADKEQPERVAWLEGIRDKNGVWSVEDLINCKFTSGRPIVMTVETKEKQDKSGTIAVHMFEMFTPRLQKWYKHNFLNRNKDEDGGSEDAPSF